MKNISKTLSLFALSFFLSNALFAEDKIWTDALKANVMHGEVMRNSKTLFKVSREGNVAKITLPTKPTIWDSKLWIFEVNYEGQYQTASWDNKSKSWVFNLRGNGIHTVYVSKRLNNVKKLPHSWFVLSY